VRGVEAPQRRQELTLAAGPLQERPRRTVRISALRSVLFQRVLRQCLRPCASRKPTAIPR
jgi:hypothetical protein